MGGCLHLRLICSQGLRCLNPTGRAEHGCKSAGVSAVCRCWELNKHPPVLLFFFFFLPKTWQSITWYQNNMCHDTTHGVQRLSGIKKAEHVGSLRQREPWLACLDISQRTHDTSGSFNPGLLCVYNNPLMTYICHPFVPDLGSKQFRLLAPTAPIFAPYEVIIISIDVNHLYSNNDRKAFFF